MPENVIGYYLKNTPLRPTNKFKSTMWNQLCVELLSVYFASKTDFFRRASCDLCKIHYTM